MPTPPLFPEFEPLSLKHKAYFQRFSRLVELNSDYSFANLFVWNTNGEAMVSQLNDLAILLYPNYNNPEDSLCLVIGDGDMLVPTFRAVLDSGKAPNIDLVPNVLFDDATLQKHGLLAKPDRNSYDYVYYVAALSAADTPNFRHLRRGVNVFKNNHHGKLHLEIDVEIDNPTHATIQGLMTITEQWGMARYGAKIYEEGLAIKRSLEHLRDLELKLAVLTSDDVEIGFIIYEFIGKNDDTVLIHFEKNADYDSLGHYLKKAFFDSIAAHQTKEIIHINYEQDLGIEGLRNIKQSLNPHTLNEVSTIYLAD